MTVTDIYLIRTQNSTYEIKVLEVQGGHYALCMKLGVDTTWHRVKADDMSFLEKLCIGPSFDVPGVVLTSRVQDYIRFVPSGEPKRTPQEVIAKARGKDGLIPIFSNLAEAIVAQVNEGNQAIVVIDETDNDEAYS